MVSVAWLVVVVSLATKMYPLPSSPMWASVGCLVVGLAKFLYPLYPSRELWYLFVSSFVILLVILFVDFVS